MDNTSTRSSPVPSRANSRRAASASAATSCTPSITGGSRGSSGTLPQSKTEASRRNMMAHTLVLEEVMEQFDLLPVRFGTIAPAAGSVEARLLAPRYQEFTELLEQMRGRIEVGLKAFWYEGAAVAEVVRENETI